MSCPALGCDAEGAPDHRFCDAHWEQLDPFLQGELMRHYSPDAEGVEWLEALDSATAHLAWVEDRMTSEEAADWLADRGRARQRQAR